MTMMNLLTVMVVAGLGWIVIHIAQRRRAGTSLIDLSFARNAMQIGVLLLIIAGFGAWFAIEMDTSVQTEVGRVNNLGLMASQQSRLILFGFIGIIGTLLLVFAKRR